MISVQFTPTVPHCSLATLIGLCIRVKLQENLPFQYKLDIKLTPGSHDTELEGKILNFLPISEQTVFIKIMIRNQRLLSY